MDLERVLTDAEMDAGRRPPIFITVSVTLIPSEIMSACVLSCSPVANA
jgi:hypothetical protein